MHHSQPENFLPLLHVVTLYQQTSQIAAVSQIELSFLTNLNTQYLESLTKSKVKFKIS